MINTLIFPLTLLIEEIHLFSDMVSIDHVKVESLVLLEVESSLSCEVIIGSHRDPLSDWDSDLIHSSNFEHVKSELSALGKQLHFQYEMLGESFLHYSEYYNQAI